MKSVMEFEWFGLWQELLITVLGWWRFLSRTFNFNQFQMNIVETIGNASTEIEQHDSFFYFKSLPSEIEWILRFKTGGIEFRE